MATGGDHGARVWGATRSGRTAHLFRVESPDLIAEISDYGCIVQSLLVRDSSGSWRDVVLGFDSLAEYEDASPYFGATIGRYANRIADAQFMLDGQTWHLADRPGAPANMRHLHGGPEGFDKRIWAAQPLANGIEFTLKSPDGDQGYPGELLATCRVLVADSTLRFEFEAETSAPTHVNFCHHGYFNLSGQAAGSCAGHTLTLAADLFLPVDERLIPVGEPAPVEGTCFDFRASRVLAWPIEPSHDQLRLTTGHDHNWVLNRPDDGSLTHAARLASPDGLSMDVYTTEPGIQYYDGNSIPQGLVGKHGTIYAPHQGVCLETQHFPNSPNRPDFPTTRLNPGEVYRSMTEYRFAP